MELLMKHEETLFTRFVGSSPTMRVLELLILGRGLDYSLSDIEEGAEVGWTTLHEVIPRLLETGMIKHTRCIGRAKMYQINKESPHAQMFIQLFDKVIFDDLEKRIAEQEGVKAKVKA